MDPVSMGVVMYCAGTVFHCCTVLFILTFHVSISTGGQQVFLGYIFIGSIKEEFGLVI
jgi:hypothetical protein